MILQEGSMEVKLKQQISNRNELGIFTQQNLNQYIVWTVNDALMVHTVC